MLSGDECYGDEITSPLYRPLAEQLASNPKAQSNESSWEGASLTFEEWMEAVNQIVLEATGISVHDLPDLQFRDHYDHGCTPDEFCLDTLGIEDGEVFDVETLRSVIMG